MRHVRLYDREQGRDLGLTVALAETLWARAIGYRFRFCGPTEKEGLLLLYPRPRRAFLDTFGVFFPLGIIGLDEDFRVVDSFVAQPSAGPYTFCRPVRAVLEIHPRRAPDFPQGRRITWTGGEERA